MIKPALDNVKRKVAVISSQAFALTNFRGALIQAMSDEGLLVYALAPDFDDEIRSKIRALGAIPIDYSLSRTGLNPVRDLLDFASLVLTLKRLSPDVCFASFIKPVIYGSIAAWIARVPLRYSMIEGLGYTFMDSSEQGDIFRSILRKTVSHLYGLALKLNRRVIFLNREDTDLFLAGNLVIPEQVARIDGIGLDLDHFSPARPVVSPVTFILVARMIKEKGVYDYVEAARKVREHCPQAQFILVGGTDPNPSSVKESELREWVREGLIEWAQAVNDVRPSLARASVFVLPSYYREGLPRSSQEAMAMGRPVITTDWVGCRDTVEHGLNGFLVPVRDPDELTKAMMRFISEPELIESMGKEGRKIAQERFDVHSINRQILEIMSV